MYFTSHLINLSSQETSKRLFRWCKIFVKRGSEERVFVLWYFTIVHMNMKTVKSLQACDLFYAIAILPQDKLFSRLFVCLSDSPAHALKINNVLPGFFDILNFFVVVVRCQNKCSDCNVCDCEEEKKSSVFHSRTFSLALSPSLHQTDRWSGGFKVFNRWS